MNLTIFHNLMTAYRFSLESEEELKLQMAKVMQDNDIPFKREYRLDPKNKPDFMVFEYAVEVKIKGAAKAIYRQCERYSTFDEVKGLYLITNKSMGFPETLNGKPCYVINLGRSWLG